MVLTLMNGSQDLRLLDQLRKNVLKSGHVLQAQQILSFRVRLACNRPYLHMYFVEMMILFGKIEHR